MSSSTGERFNAACLSFAGSLSNTSTVSCKETQCEFVARHHGQSSAYIDQPYRDHPPIRSRKDFRLDSFEGEPVHFRIQRILSEQAGSLRPGNQLFAAPDRFSTVT
jgi:hypothetical protein